MLGGFKMREEFWVFKYFFFNWEDGEVEWNFRRDNKRFLRVRCIFGFVFCIFI